MADEAVAGIAFELNFDGSKMTAGIRDACEKVKDSFEKAFTQAGKKATDTAKTSNEEINKILNDTTRSAKSKAAAIAAVYKKQGESQSDVFKKAWEHIERDSKNGSKKVKNHIKGIGDRSKKTAKEVERNFSIGFAAVAKKAAGLLIGAFAFRKIKDFGAKCLELGSDLAEVQNVVDVTFPHMTAQVDEFAKSAAQSFGLSETMAKQYTGTFGAMAKAFGFTEKEAYDMGTTLTGLTGDVASFYNLNQDEAYTKLKSVFTGETESLKDLGVVMTQTALDAYALANGYGKTTSAMTEAEKVSLRYAFVQDQLSAATGDFARTSGSWANQVRIMKLQMESLMATIGQGLINLFTPALRAINTLLGRLATLANAFKSFTELITGQKSSGASDIAAPVADLTDTAEDAESGLNSAADAANNLSNSTKKAGDTVKKTAKKMKSLMGFDKINKLDAPTTSTGSSGTGKKGTTKGTGQSLGQNVDFGDLAEGETVVDKVDSKFAALIKRAKELAALFKKGFRIGFGDSEKKIQSINAGITSIGKNLKDIFTDSKVADAAGRCMDAIALSLGKITGSVASIGLSIGDNLVGGLDKYLQKSKDYIKERIISLFDVQSELATVIGDFSVAIAQIFDLFSSDEAKGITADIIQIFSDGFLGALDLAQKFIRDIVEFLVTPFIQNVELIKVTLGGMLEGWQIVFDTIAQCVTNAFEKVNQVYDEHIKPLMDALGQGISDLLTVFLEGWNTYISPVLDALAERFSSVWSESIQPALDGILDLIGKIADAIKVLWEKVVVPFLSWIIKNILPKLSPVISTVGTIMLNLLELIGKVIKGITDILGGLIDFCIGVFTGDWERAWSGIGGIISGFRTLAQGIFEYLKKTILLPFINWVKETFGKKWEQTWEEIGKIASSFQQLAEEIFDSLQKNVLTPFMSYVRTVFETDWSESFGTLGTILNTFLDSVKTVWGDIEDLFSGIIDFITGVFSGDWEKAWEGIIKIFSSIFDGLGTLAKTPLNMVIDIVNGLFQKLNSGLEAIEKAFSFEYDFTNPLTGTRHYGKYGLSLPSIPEIPHLAQGGYVKPNTPQLAMIGDNRHQGEVVAPENKLKQMAADAVREASGGGITRADLESVMNNAVMRIVAALAGMGFYLDGEQMARVMRSVEGAMDARFNPVSME